MAKFFRRLRTFPAADPAGREYAIEAWGDGGRAAPVLRHNGRPVEWVSKGVYRIPAAASPTGADLDLRAQDTDAP